MEIIQQDYESHHRPRKAKYPVKELQNYAQGVWLNQQNKKTLQYLQINLSFNPNLVDIEALVLQLNQSWVNKPKQFIHPAPSGCLDPIVIGYLGRSTWQMLITHNFATEHMMNNGLKLGFVTKGIAVKGVVKPAHAIHIECDKHNITTVINYCRKTWPSKASLRKSPVLGYKLSFVSTVNSIGIKLKNEDQHRRNKKVQRLLFSKFILSTKCQELYGNTLKYSIVHPTTCDEFTLCQFLCTMKHLPREDDDSPGDLFFAVSRDNDSTSVWFHYFHHLAKEAETVI